MSSFLTRSHFELFSLPERHALDRDELASRFRDLQRNVHPDRFASAGDQERRLSMQHATRLNEAYEVLRDPMMRGRYLLELRGYHPDEQPQTASDPAFLMQQMELREALAAVREEDDPIAALDRVARDIRGQYRELEQALGEALDREPPDNEKALELVLRMQFYSRLQNELQELEADLEDELY